jgi:hypothetical protein
VVAEPANARIGTSADELVYYASHIEVLKPDHPERRFVAALCIYSHAVDTARAGRRYDQREPRPSRGRC